MKISIIIPCYNHQEYLQEAITSALGQTVLSEIIVIDDGSTDNSLSIAKSFENKGVKVISQVNKGLSSARNTGIMNATGEYILPLDSDDALIFDCVERMIEEIEKTNADIIVPSFRTFGISSLEFVLKNVTLEDFITANRFGYFSAIRKSKLLEVGGYSPRMTWGYEDYHLWFDLLKRGATVSVLPDILVMYRVKENSMLTEAVKHHEELMNQIKKDHAEVFTQN